MGERRVVAAHLEGPVERLGLEPDVLERQQVRDPAEEVLFVDHEVRARRLDRRHRAGVAAVGLRRPAVRVGAALVVPVVERADAGCPATRRAGRSRRPRPSPRWNSANPHVSIPRTDRRRGTRARAAAANPANAWSAAAGPTGTRRSDGDGHANTPRPSRIGDRVPSGPEYPSAGVGGFGAGRLRATSCPGAADPRAVPPRRAADTGSLSPSAPSAPGPSRSGRAGAPRRPSREVAATSSSVRSRTWIEARTGRCSNACIIRWSRKAVAARASAEVTRNRRSNTSSSRCTSLPSSGSPDGSVAPAGHDREPRTGERAAARRRRSSSSVSPSPRPGSRLGRGGRDGKIEPSDGLVTPVPHDVRHPGTARVREDRERQPHQVGERVEDGEAQARSPAREHDRALARVGTAGPPRRRRPAETRAASPTIHHIPRMVGRRGAAWRRLAAAIASRPSADGDGDGVAVVDLAGQQREGERVLDLALDQALQRPGAERGVVAGVRQVVARRVGERRA